jgi:hypothetical protein
MAVFATEREDESSLSSFVTDELSLVLIQIICTA